MKKAKRQAPKRKCQACGGTGRIRTGRTYVKCPVCKGRGYK